MNVVLYTILLLPMHSILLVLNSTNIPLSNTFKSTGITPQILHNHHMDVVLVVGEKELGTYGGP